MSTNFRQAEWPEARVRALLNRSDAAVQAAVVVLFNRQTSFEKCSQNSVIRNRRGFTHIDAGYFTRLAEQINAGRPISPEQLAFLRAPIPMFGSRIGKYWHQLSEEIAFRPRKNEGFC